MNDDDLSKQTLEQYDDPEFAAAYADKCESRLEPWEIDEFLAQLPKGSRVLDAGCAAGRDTAYIADKGYQVIGIDLAAALISEARRRHPGLEFVVGDFTALPFKDSEFDGLWNRAALVHMPSQELVRKSIQEFARVLKPGGVTMIRTKAQMEGGVSTAVRKDKLSDRNRYFRFQKQSEIEDDIRNAGFEIVSSRVFNELELADKYEDVSQLRDEDWVLIVARKRS
jgi:SAM-dependent methyltransferase